MSFIASDDEAAMVQYIEGVVNEISENGFIATTALLGDAEVIVIASQQGQDGSKDAPVLPLFLLPAPEIILQLIDPITKEAVFNMARTN